MCRQRKSGRSGAKFENSKDADLQKHSRAANHTAKQPQITPWALCWSAHAKQHYALAKQLQISAKTLLIHVALWKSLIANGAAVGSVGVKATRKSDGLGLAAAATFGRRRWRSRDSDGWQGERCNETSLQRMCASVTPKSIGNKICSNLHFFLDFCFVHLARLKIWYIRSEISLV